jgi:hypothetical protein
MKFVIVLLIFAFLFSCHNATKSPISNASSDTLPKLSNKSDSLQSPHIYPDTIDEQNIQKAEISKSDSSFSVFDNIRKDYRIFGYEQPDTNSKRLIVFSVFTRDVDANPYKCDYGAFYKTSSMENAQIKYKSVVGSFVETELYTGGRKTADLFFERKWIEFTD